MSEAKLLCANNGNAGELAGCPCHEAMRGIPDPSAFVAAADALAETLASMEGAMAYGKIGASWPIMERLAAFRLSRGEGEMKP